MQRRECSVEPPRTPWTDLESATDAGGYLTIYYSDDMSPLPVRWVTKPGDNKSDPNLETLTYGLFSVCAKSMRRGIVNRKSRYLFFATRRGECRVLCGYYRLRWYANGIFGTDDPAIAADHARFTAKPIPLEAVDKELDTQLGRPFRGSLLLGARVCSELRRLIDTRPNAMSFYLAEIDRLERFNLRHGGYRYIGWRKSTCFSWADAKKYLAPSATPGPHPSNSTPSNLWRCEDCGGAVQHRALLKCCPHCGAPGTLRA
jgi:hypothetical protein